MQRFQEALDQSIQRAFSDEAGLCPGAAVERVLIAGHYLELIPPTQRNRFRTQLLGVATQGFTVAFTQRYTDAGPESLANAWEAQSQGLAALLQRSLRTWDSELSRQGREPNLRQRFPIQRMRRDLETSLNEVFQAGQRAGYSALKHRLAEDRAQGLTPQQSFRDLARGYASILNHITIDLSPAATVEPALAYR